MRYYVEKSLRNFNFWSGGKDTADALTYEQIDRIEAIMEDCEPAEGWSDTAINDFFWFERDTIAEWLGYEDWEDLERKHRGEEDDAVKKILREFIMDNMPAPPKDKLQMKEFLSEDKEFRPALCCICMDNEEKVAVATNAHILFASKEYYVDKGREGESKTLVDEYGDVVKEELRYPNWKAVIPREDQTEPIVLRSDLEELIKLAQVEAKELGLKKIDVKTNIRVADELCIRLDYLKLMLKAGVDRWRKPKNKVGGIVKQWDGNTMLVMPILPPEQGEENYDNMVNKGYWFNR